MAIAGFILAVVGAHSPTRLFLGLTPLVVNLPWESGVHLSGVASALNLLLFVIAIGSLSSRRFTRLLVFFREVTVKWGQSPLQDIKSLQKIDLISIKFRNK
jgi:hypothetical protein